MGKCILAGHPPVGGIGCGTYTGDGAASRTISLGVTPKWVLVIQQGTWWGNSTGPTYVSGLALCGNSAICDYGAVVSISGDGFIVYFNSNGTIASNRNGIVYHYLFGV